MKYNSANEKTPDFAKAVTQVSEPHWLAQWIHSLCSCFRATPKPVELSEEITFFLPDKSEEFDRKKTLVLDLDETLVHSAIKTNDSADMTLDLMIDQNSYKVSVLKRPWVNEFLNRCADLFEIVIFTASLPEYADPLLDQLDKDKVISHRLYRQHCTVLSNRYTKDLTKLNRDLKEVIIVDVILR